jgi:hypothetical protein
VCRYDTNRFRLTVRRRNGGAGAEFEANITLVDASGYDLIEIDERSTLRAGLGNLDRLNLLNWRAGVIDHANDCECPLVLASDKDNQSDRASDVQKKSGPVARALLVPPALGERGRQPPPAARPMRR